MILENLDIINKKVLCALKLYEEFNEILNEIILNNYKFSSEKVEFIKSEIMEKNKNIQFLRQNILKIKIYLQIKNFHNNFYFINNISKLELNINKFWYKFYSKLEKENKKAVNYWRNEYLECYKKLFFQNKNLDIAEINNNEDKPLKNKINFSSLKM